MGAPARSAGWWSDRSIRAKGLVVIAVPIVLLLAVLGSISWFTHVNDRAQSIGTEGRNALTVLDDLENNVSKADDAVRGYLLTGAPQYLSTYRSAISSAPGSLQELSSLSSEGLAHGATYHALDGTTKGLLADLVQLSSQMGAPSASPATQGLLRSSETDSARFSGAASELDEEINSSLTGLHSTIHSSSTDLLVITIAATVLALGGGIALSQLFTSGVTTRLRRLERATETLEQGGLPTDAPGGSDEIGRLSERLTVAASQLRDRATERDGARSQLEDILTASPVVSIRYDVASRRFSYASPNVSRLFGVTPEKVIEDPSIVIDRFHPEDAIRLRDLLVSASQRQGERVETLLRFRRDLSTEAWGDVEAVYTLERDPQGTLEGVVAYFVDASERHLAQRAADERRSMLESIFHASPDTIVVRDVEGHVVLASSSLAGLIGVADDVRRGAVLGPDVPVLGEVSLVDRKLLDSLTARCIAGEPTPDPVVTSSHLPGGETLTFETRARPVIDDSGHVTGTVTVSREITDRVRLEQSLRGASAAAARASEAKSEFLSRMSHELRTPLNAILGFAQLLELDDLPEDQQSSIDQIQRAGRHLLSLINEVLDISRIESGRLSLALEPVGVGDLLDEVTTLLAPAAEGAELQLTVGSGDQRGQYVHADRQRLLQVLLNLGSNALKYNQRGGSVSFRTSRAEGGRIRFEVRDTGPGIPREQQDQLFVPFSRLGAEQSAVEGTGVGLALSKQLVELMGGSIGVESVPGRGSTFWVELLPARARREDDVTAATPSTTADQADGADEAADADDAADADEAAGARPALGVAAHMVAESSGAQRSLVVLQVEDNPSNASLVEQILARRPEVRLVSTSEAGLGLELAREYRPDLILLDLHLPDLPGEELLYRLKAVPELAEIKVVVVSADATPSRIRRMLDLGVEGYLTKPVDVEALLRLVDLEISGSRRATL